MNYDLPREREQEGEGERGLQWQQTNVGTGDKIERCVTVVPGSPKDTVLGVVPARGVAMPENAERHRAVSRIASQTPSPSAVSISLCVLLVLGGKSASFALRTKRYSRLQPQQPPCCSCCCCCPSPSRAAQHKLRISIFMFPCDAAHGAFAVAAYDLCAAMTHRTVLVQLQSLPGPTPPTPPRQAVPAAVKITRKLHATREARTKFAWK